MFDEPMLTSAPLPLCSAICATGMCSAVLYLPPQSQLRLQSMFTAGRLLYQYVEYADRPNASNSDAMRCDALRKALAVHTAPAMFS